MTIRVAIAADHGGYALKNELMSYLGQEYDILDLGADSFDPGDDYPDFAEKVAWAISQGEAARGILICGSGVGACIAANKVPNVRACLCHDSYSAHQGVEHDNMNILCLGARVIGVELAKELTVTFLRASFSREERHSRRLKKIQDIEHRALQEPE